MSPSIHHTNTYSFQVVHKACKYIGAPSCICPQPIWIPLVSHTHIMFFPHKCAGTHSLSSFLCCCLGAESSCLLPVTHHHHLLLSPVTKLAVTHYQTCCYLPPNHCCLLRGPKPCICHHCHHYLNLSLLPCQTSPWWSWITKIMKSGKYWWRPYLYISSSTMSHLVGCQGQPGHPIWCGCRTGKTRKPGPSYS